MPPRDTCMPACIPPATCLAGGRTAWLATGESAPLARRGRIAFTGGNHAVIPDASALLSRVKAWQAQDLPRQVIFAEGLRMVGFGELPAYPCGGTHVARRRSWATFLSVRLR